MDTLSLFQTNNTLVGKNSDFESVWIQYNRRGSKKEALKQWNALTEQERKTVIEHVPQYVASIADPRYQKHFERYLKSKHFESEPLPPQNPFSGGF